MQYALGFIGLVIFVCVILPTVLSALAIGAAVLAVFLAMHNAGQATAHAVQVRRGKPAEIIFNEAHHAYLLGPAWTDMHAFFTDCNERALDSIRTEREALRVAKEPIPIAFRVFSLIFATTIGLVASFAVSAVIGALLAVAASILAALFGILMLTDKLWLVSHGWFVHCPNCDLETYHLHYDCPKCTAVPPLRHRHLRVNRAGALFHHCASCHGAVPSHVLTGRGRIANAYCTNCSLPIGRELVEAKVSHVALAGGPDSGKTTLLVAAASWMQSSAWLAHTHIKVELEEQAQRLQMAAWVLQLSRGQAPPKTSAVRHRAYTFLIRVPEQRLRSLYFFDTSGEMFRNQSLKDKHGYIAEAKVILFTLDPFSLTRFVEPLRDTPDWRAVSDASPSATMPWEVASSLINMLDGAGVPRQDGRFAVPLLVVLTKTDVLGLHAQMRAGRNGVKGWLESHGGDDVMRVLDSNFSDVRYRSVLTPLSDMSKSPRGIDDLMTEVLQSAMPDLRLTPTVLAKETV